LVTTSQKSVVWSAKKSVEQTASIIAFVGTKREGTVSNMKATILMAAITLSSCSLVTINTHKTHKNKCTESEIAPVVDFALMVTALGLRLHYNHENKIEEGSRFDPFAATGNVMMNGAFYSSAFIAGASGLYGAYHVSDCQKRRYR